MATLFTPGNGIEPKYLAGRDDHMAEFSRCLRAFGEGLPRNIAVYGIRGTGKTVLAHHYRVIAESENWAVVEREFNAKLADELVFGNAICSDIVSSASSVSLRKKIEETGKNVFEKIKPATISVQGIEYRPYYGERNQLLSDYLKDVLVSNWDVFRDSGRRGVLLLYDEMHNLRDARENNQYALSSFLEALSYAQRKGCKYCLCACGLPALKTNLKTAKTYSERMFLFQEVGNLNREDAIKALTEPLKGSHFSLEGNLPAAIASETAGYPYFIQFYGHYLTENCGNKKILPSDFIRIKHRLVDSLDKSFFEDRFNLASDSEKKILLAMARAEKKEVSTSKIMRDSKVSYGTLIQLLIRLSHKGLIYKIRKGKYDFAIPLFRDYLLRC